MSNQRIFWADNLKGFLIILVVLGHVIQYSYDSYDSLHLYNYIYSFHMPAFMAISGFLSYKQNNLAYKTDRIRKRGLQLLIPYLFWTLSYCAVMNTSVIKCIYESPTYWFLILLFFISVLMALCQWVSDKFRIYSVIICTLMFVTLLVIQVICKPYILSLNILYVHFFFYSIGWFIRKYESILLHDWMIFPFGCLYVGLGGAYSRFSSPAFVSFIPLSVYFIISGMVGTILFMVLFRKFVSISFSIIGKLGRKTLGLYVIHLLICCSCSPLFHVIIESLGLIIGILFISVLLVVISYFITQFFEKSKIIGFIVGSI